MQGVGIQPSGEDFAAGGHDRVIGAGQARNAVQEDDYIPLVFHQSLGLFTDHFRHLHMALRRFVKGRTHHFGAHVALHVGYFFRAFIDQQHDEIGFLMVDRDSVGDILQEHGLTGARLCDDQAALPEADGSQQVHDPCREVVGNGFQFDPAVGVKGREVVKKDLIPCHLRVFVVDGLDLEKGKIAFVVFGGADLAGDAVPRSQAETANLGR